jgi:hypothetical protein
LQNHLLKQRISGLSKKLIELNKISIEIEKRERLISSTGKAKIIPALDDPAMQKRK